MIFGRKKDKDNPFKDVNTADEFYPAVMWALKNGIADGAEPNRFEPLSGCTRGEAVTFLYRAMGRPQVKTETSPFIDIKDGDYCCEAVLWAVENKIGNPISERIFAANASCARAQFVTFLHRAQGSPVATNRSCGFVDVHEGDFFYEPVLWAVEQGILSGVSDGIFGPYTICSRAQVVTYLHRFFGK